MTTGGSVEPTGAMKRLETADRGLRMLQAFETDRQELTVTALAGRLGVHRSTASRLAATLARRGFLERAPGSDAFRLGPELARLGLLAMGVRDLAADARPVMEGLAEKTGETVVLSVREGSGVVDIAQVNGPRLIGVRNWIGTRTALHATSDGKVLLALSDSDFDLLPDLQAFTQQTITDLAALHAQLGQVRKQGWAVAISEFEEGLHGAAAPVFDVSGRCVAALSVSGPAYRVPADRLAGFTQACVEAALAISARLGHVGESSDGARRP